MSSPTQSQAAAKVVQPGSVSRSALLCSAWFAATCLLFFAPLTRFVRYALSNDNASHAILIPAICAWILYLERERVFAAVTPARDLRCGALFFVPGCLVAAAYFFYGSRLSELN